MFVDDLEEIQKPIYFELPSSFHTLKKGAQEIGLNK